jgi:aldehyde dehydrogenase (NAD+)
MKPAVLELGGKSASLIFDDADLEAAARWNTLRVLGTVSGQGCAFPTRMIIQETIYDEMVERVAAIARTIAVGDPFDPATVIGPVVNVDAVDRILGLIERAERDGARRVHGGRRIVDRGMADGYYLQPTVFADVDPMSELGQTEVFGPVLSLMPFKDEQDAISIANCTRYGLSSYIQTTDLKRAHRLAEQLIAGATMINGAPNLMVNRPFGGTGFSGYGKEGGVEGIEEFLRVKTVAIA